jgi:hypothetical protein
MFYCLPTSAASAITIATAGLLATPAWADAVSIKAACEAISVESCTIQSLELRPTANDDYRLDMVISGQDRNFMVWEHDIRGENYRLIVQESDGSFTDDTPGPITTYRGIDGVDGQAILALGYETDGFRVRIIEPDGSQWFAEPLVDRVAGADANDYAVYEDKAIISPENICPVDEAWRVTDNTPVADYDANEINTRGAELAAAMAVDCDYEFYQQYGSVVAVEARVMSVINSVNLQYENQCSLTHEMQAIVVRSSSNDPYSTNSIDTRLDQLQNDWNSNNHPGISRDMVHLFTGASTGSTIGLAYLGAVCSTFEYGVVQSNCCGSFGCATDLSAHEMGHNWNSDHCNCPNNTMNPSLTCANQFSTSSISSITNFADNNSSCLSVPGPSGACCIGSSCQIYALIECDNFGGVFQGDGTNCTDSPCNLATGACCLSSGSCVVVAESQCINVGGEYQGDDVPCDGEICLPEPTGACCYNDSCSITEEANCAGTWLGADTDCVGTPCTDNNFTGVAWKVVGTNLADTPQDTWTVDIYAILGNGERIDAVAGNSNQLKTVSASEGFWQSGYGGPTSAEVNPAFYDLVPDLPYDSRVTIGALDSSGDPFPSNDLNSIGIDFSNFENGGAISASNGTWFVVQTDEQGEAQPILTDDCTAGHGVLIGRLTAYGHTSDVMVEALFQGRNALGVTWQATGGTTATLGNWADCNGNDVNDACDIAGGGSSDANENGIPDECDQSNCEWDINGDGMTDVNDLLEVIGGFPDLYNVDDLLALLSEFGCE